MHTCIHDSFNKCSQTHAGRLTVLLTNLMMVSGGFQQRLRDYMTRSAFCTKFSWSRQQQQVMHASQTQEFCRSQVSGSASMALFCLLHVTCTCCALVSLDLVPHPLCLCSLRTSTHLSTSNYAYYRVFHSLSLLLCACPCVPVCRCVSHCVHGIALASAERMEGAKGESSSSSSRIDC